MKKMLRALLISFTVLLVSMAGLAWKYAGGSWENPKELVSKRIVQKIVLPNVQEDKTEVQLPKHYEHYYEQLSTQEQAFYQELYGAIKEHANGKKISMMDMDTLEKILQYIILDNPELFYIENVETETISIAGVNTLMRVSVIENMERALQPKAKEKIQTFKENFMEQVPDNMSDEEKAELAFTYVVDKLDYVAGAQYNQSLYSAALGETVCMGYTAAYKYLCDQMGIPCIAVIGTMAGNGHAWNMVYLDHIWYQVDCTQGDDLVTYPPKIDYKWFKISTAELKKTHTFQEPELLPASQ